MGVRFPLPVSFESMGMMSSKVLEHFSDERDGSSDSSPDLRLCEDEASKSDRSRRSAPTIKEGSIFKVDWVASSCWKRVY